MEITINLESIAQPLGKSVQELSEALSSEEGKERTIEEVSNIISEAFSDRLKGARSTAKDEGYKWGVKESLTKAEKDFAEKFGIEPDTFENMGAALAEKAKGSVQIDPNDVRNSEVYKADREKWESKLQEKETQLASIVNEHTTEKIKSRLSDRLNPILEKYNVNKQHLVTKLKDDAMSDKVRLGLNPEDGKLRLLTESGEVAKNEFGDPIVMEEWLEGHVKNYFDLKTSKPGTPGSETEPPKGGVGATAFNFTAPKNPQEAMETFNSITDPEKKKAYRNFTRELETQGKI